MSPSPHRPTFNPELSGLTFPEGPRWHNDALWFSDMYDGRVIRWQPGEQPATAVELDDNPSGLGFLPDDRLLVVAMHRQQVLRHEHDGGLAVHADLSGVATGQANDMLVDNTGRAYVGNFGDDSAPPAPVAPATLARVDPDGSVHPAADDLYLPNGMGLLDHGNTLVVAETRATPPRLCTFTIDTDGTLSNRRVLVELETEMPDGLTVDAHDNVWFASPFTTELIRVDRSGEVTARLQPPTRPYACVLGGRHRDTLFVCAADEWRPEQARAHRSGAILSVDISRI